MPALVSDATGVTAVGPEQVIPATQGDDSLAALAMFAVLGDGVDETGHSAVLQSLRKTESSVLAPKKTPHDRTPVGNITPVSAENYNEWATLDSNQ